MTDPNEFEKALIEVRNECLHKINPEKFKFIRKIKLTLYRYYISTFN